MSSCRLKDIAYDWVVIWKKSTEENAAPMIWQIFYDAFLDKFFPREMMETKIEDFMKLR